MITVALADADGLAWAQRQVAAHHYLHTRVDPRCAPLAYLILAGGARVGCLIFGRPEATRCFVGQLTYGGAADVAAGRATFDRWEIVNLARVWLTPAVQAGGATPIPCAASRAIGQALRRIVLDALLARPPCFPAEPWRLQMCLSYCDTRQPGHHGTIYRAAGFWRAHRNAAGIETWVRPLRRLTGREVAAVLRAAAQSPRSRLHRARRAAAAEQLALRF